MKPIRLEIQGINSYEEKQVVDFEKLISRGIFGIFGKTGSGKSTILDAITLALYGNIARGTKGFINSNTDNAYVLFRFEILNGNIRDVYEVVRKFKKKIVDDKISVNTGTVKLSKIVKYEDKTEEQNVLAEKVKEVDAEIYNILGLTEDDFLKSVILPQGKFSEFLLLNGKDKRNMLERLFGLESYGTFLNLKLQKNKSEVKNEIAVLDGKLAEFPDATEEKIKEYTEKLNLINENIEKLGKDFEKEKNKLNEYREIYSILIEKENFSRELDFLKNNEAEIKSLEERISNFSKLRDVFLEIDRREKSKKDLELVIAEGKKLKEEVEIIKAKYSKINEEYEKIYNLREKLPEIKSKNILVKNIFENEYLYLEYIFENEKLLNESNLLNANFKKLSEEIELKENNFAKINQDIKKIALEEENSSFSLDYKEDINTANEILTNIEKYKLSKKEIIDRKIKIENEVKILENSLKEDLKIFDELKDRVKKLEFELEKSSEIQMISHVRESILNSCDCICPVCLNNVDKNVISKNEEIFAFDENEEVLKNLNLDLEEIKAKNIQIKTQIQEKKTYIDEIESQLNNIQYEILKLEEELTSYKLKYGDLDFIKEMLRILNLEKNFFELRSRKDELTSQKEKLLNEINSKKLNIGECKSKEDNVLQKIEENRRNISNILIKLNEYFNNLDFEKFTNTVGIYSNINYIEFNESVERQKVKEDTITLKNLYVNIEKFATELENSYLKLKSEKEKVENALNVLTENYRNKQAEFQVLNISFKDIQIKIMKLLSLNNFSSEEEIVIFKFTDQEYDIFTEKIKKFHNDINVLKGKLQFLDSRLNDRTVTEEMLKEQTEKFENVENLLTEMQKEEISLKINLDNTIDNLKKVEEYKKQLSVFNKKLSTILQLEKFLKGNRFVEFLSKMYLNNIVFDSSARLDSITNGRYSLEIDSDYSFVICDNFNGGIRRAIDTLSGGEIFLTSLSLALSLSTQVQLKGSAPLEFFFLDEGFGTLDSELLDIVMGSLEKLHSDKLSVGIISHVEELKNRIPTKLIVKMDKNKLTSIVNIEYS